MPGTSATVIVTFRVDGVRKDGMAVSTGDFQFPVTVCNGCIKTDGCPPQATDGGTPATPTPSFCDGYPGQSPYACQ